MKLIEQLHAAGMTYTDVVRLTNGRLTENMLKKANARSAGHLGESALSPENTALLNQVIAAYRMSQEHVKWVVFEAVGVKKPVAQKAGVG